MPNEVSPQVLKTNYRKAKKFVYKNAITSQIVFLATPIICTASIATQPMTISMMGYGSPAAVWFAEMSQPNRSAGVPITIHPTQSFSGSVGWVYAYQSDTDYTGTTQFGIFALIASR